MRIGKYRGSGFDCQVTKLREALELYPESRLGCVHWDTIDRAPARPCRKPAGGRPVVPLDALCAQWHGRERARLSATGNPPALYDGLIASIAVVNELVLVTHNTADFRKYAGIRLEDWQKS
jgi:hypothetical protein